jgi:GT2 family glycosyltransferase
MLNQIGIGIPTRDRWDDLAFTLRKLQEFGLGDNETIVMDDASRTPAPRDLVERFPRVRFLRSERSRYVTGQRNDLARLLTSPYFLQIDDDSFPVRGDLEKAVAWLEARKDALALAFIVTDGEDYSARIDEISAEPFRCHYFIGCAGLIKRERFLELGSYEESLEYSGEEIALALHAQLHGLFVYQYAGVVVQHNPSRASRNQQARASMLIRNELLVAGLHYPLLFLLARAPLFVLKALVHRWVPRRNTLLGVRAALGLYPAIWRRRRVVPMREFLVWKRLPAPVEFKEQFLALTSPDAY